METRNERQTNEREDHIHHKQVTVTVDSKPLLFMRYNKIYILAICNSDVTPLNGMFCV